MPVGFYVGLSARESSEEALREVQDPAGVTDEIRDLGLGGWGGSVKIN